MSANRIVNIYNPANQTEQELLDNFVVRSNEFNKIFSDLRYSRATLSDPHIIIQGQRGQGKTTLLLKLYYETRNDPELKWRFVPIIFNEEQYNIRTLFDLWENVAEELEEILDLGGLTDEVGRYAAMHKKDPETKAFEMLKMVMEKYRRKLVLFIDNFGDILHRFSEDDRNRLMEIMISRPEIRIVGATTFSLEFSDKVTGIYKDIFKVYVLEGLGKGETVRLFLKLGENYRYETVKQIIEKEPGRLESFRRLTSGVPRTIILLFEVFTSDTKGNSVMDLEIILDRVTPLYKHRMDDLPSQQQTIVDVIALNWEAVTLKQIVKKVRMSIDVVSQQLQILEKDNIVFQVDKGLIQLKDRFFNIWYLMRHGKKKGRTQVQWFVQFLELWNTPGELDKLARHHISSMKNEADLYDKHAFYMTEALARTNISLKLQHEMIENTRKYLSKTNEELLEELSKSDIELLKGFCYMFEKEEFSAAVKYLESVKQKNALVLFNLGFLYLEKIRDIDKAEKYYILAAEQGHETAMYNLAMLYENRIKDFDAAEKYYIMATGKGHAKAMNNLALLYINHYDAFQKAEKYFFMAARAGDVKALYNLALLYENKADDSIRAEKYFLMAIKKGHTRAIYNVVTLYFQSKKNKKGALHLAKILYSREKNIHSAHLLAMMLLWNNQVEASVKIAKVLLQNEEYVEDNKNMVIEYFLLLMAKKQFRSALVIFSENAHNVRERYKPIFYALMVFLQHVYPHEYKKIGAEAKETVNEIVDRVKLMAVDYA